MAPRVEPAVCAAGDQQAKKLTQLVLPPKEDEGAKIQSPLEHVTREQQSCCYRFPKMRTFDIIVHVQTLAVGAFGILISLSGIASLWAFQKMARVAS